MNDQPGNAQSALWLRQAPGEPALRGVNWGGLKTLYIKEVRRFFKVQMQTVWAPAITTLLYLAIFTIALGRAGRTVLGVPFADFLAPGLIVMAMIQNAFANSSFSLLVGKIQGNIVDYLMPPLSTGELIAGLIGASVTRAFLVGFAVWLVMLLWPGVHVRVYHPGLVLWFGLMGSLLLSFLGLLTSIWAEKFDHAAAVGNFIVTPLSLLSGTFYSVHQLAPAFQAVSHANPFFYVISGFRAGFLGASDSPLMVGAVVLLAINIALWALCYGLLSGTFYSVHQLAPAFQAVSHANPFFYVISGFRAGFLGASDSPLLVGAIVLLAINIALWALCYGLLKAGWKIKN